MKLFITGAAYALWLAAIEIVFYLAPESQSALEAVVVLGLVPAAMQVLLLGFDPVGLASPARLIIVFVLIVLLSYVFNGGQSTQVMFVGELVYTCVLAMLVAGCPERRLLRTVASIFSVVSGLFLLYIVKTGEYRWGRLVAGGLEANFWGLMGLGVAMTAFAHRSRLLGAACFAMGFAAIYAASSRSSILGIAIAGIVIALCHAARFDRRRLTMAIGGVAVGLALIVVLAPYLRSAIPAFLDSLMKIDDPYRGVGQGFTGRDELWRYAFDLWWNSPLFGVGFRQHELFLPYGRSAHNAYLAMLADTGLFGLLWYVVFVVVSMVAAFRIPDTRTRNLALATIISYAVIGFFERRAINGGNPVSILFLALCFHALAQRDRRKVLAAESPPPRPVPAGHPQEVSRAAG